MPEIKEKSKETIKQLDKNIVQLQKLKNNIVTTKEKINEFTKNEQNDTAENYASMKVQNDLSYLSRKGLEKGNEIGKKSLQETKQNFIKGKQKIETLKTRIRSKNTKQLKNVIDNSKKTIKGVSKKSIKTAKNTKLLAKKGIKTTKMVAKNTKRVAKESVKMTQRLVRATKKAIQATIQATKLAIKAVIATVKAIIAATKAIIAAIAAGGWVAVVVILVIVLIAGFVALLFNGEEESEFNESQMPNMQIVMVAKAQIGNEGGDKFWTWYGFDSRVEWCACFVSWCANECGYIESGRIPKFSYCQDGVDWFKINGLWQGKDYIPKVGDIIFFDWQEKDTGIRNGIADHVGIVEKVENGMLYTIEGNVDDTCSQKSYDLNSEDILGYGIV